MFLIEKSDIRVSWDHDCFVVEVPSPTVGHWMTVAIYTNGPAFFKDYPDLESEIFGTEPVEVLEETSSISLKIVPSSEEGYLLGQVLINGSVICQATARSIKNAKILVLQEWIKSLKDT